MKRLLLFGILCWICTSCFQIRPVEPPDNSLSDWVSPTDHTILLRNFQTAISTRNTQNYLRCISENGFRYAPTATLKNVNDNLWTNWSIEDEQAYISNLIEQLGNRGMSLDLRELDLQDVTADSLNYFGSYTLRVPHGDTLISETYEGQLQLHLRITEVGEWEILRWQDLGTSADSSWSQLKFSFIQ
ncbi:hypothetical protein [Pontibacter sp. G13]|uniref:hypothetical protein n=1 Tax=Pontibacter sp. G13 TaxID=3074898 RepID=UPI00288BD93F|nr:hypothetical protein [Pontibacter sp. G13]WNJ18712.1 hypothetical protein RJD25_27975 [Pontibacter sp. G13]